MSDALWTWLVYCGGGYCDCAGWKCILEKAGTQWQYKETFDSSEYTWEHSCPACRLLLSMSCSRKVNHRSLSSGKRYQSVKLYILCNIGSCKSWNCYTFIKACASCSDFFFTWKTSTSWHWMWHRTAKAGFNGLCDIDMWFQGHFFWQGGTLKVIDGCTASLARSMLCKITMFFTIKLHTFSIWLVSSFVHCE